MSDFTKLQLHELNTFEQRVEDRIERQIKLAEENNRIMGHIALSLRRLAMQHAIGLSLEDSIQLGNDVKRKTS